MVTPGYYETSMILYFRPDLVVREKMQKQVHLYERELPNKPLTRATSAAYFEAEYPTGG